MMTLFDTKNVTFSRFPHFHSFPVGFCLVRNLVHPTSLVLCFPVNGLHIFSCSSSGLYSNPSDIEQRKMAFPC